MNLKTTTTKILKENSRIISQLWQRFLRKENMLTIKENKLAFFNVFKFCSSSYTIKKHANHRLGKNISDKRTVSIIYEELLQINNKRQTTQ